MENKPESGPKLLHVLITAGTTLLVALIGLGAAIYQTDKPLRLTEAAQAAQAAAQTSAAPTSPQPSPEGEGVAPSPLGEGRGEVSDTQTALAPTLAPQTSQAALPAKTDLPAAATLAPSAPSVSITNPTGTDCDVTINKGWKSEFVTHAVVSAKTDNVSFGYYELYTNANVTLDCGGQIYWWGLQPNETNGTSFFGDVEKGTGIIDFTLKP